MGEHATLLHVDVGTANDTLCSLMPENVWTKAVDSRS